MTIILRTTRIAANGAQEASEQSFPQNSVVLGRGPQCDIILTGRDISLTHAKITYGDGNYTIEDLQSLGGVSINGALIKRQTLRGSEQLKLGSHSFAVKREGADLILHAETHASAHLSSEAAVAATTQALDARRGLPSLRRVSYALVILTLLLGGLYPLLTNDRRSWSSGPVTSHHAMIGAQCSSCHTENFSKVPDAKCESCHALSLHAAAFEKNSPAHRDVMNAPCASCHLEHKGSHALVPRESALCVSCHADPQKLLPNSKLAAVVSWDKHPEFSPHPRFYRDGSPIPARTEDDKLHLVDHGTLKLNHALHLKKDLRGADGPVTLQCQDCHALSRDYKTIKPFSMEQNCRSCHSLGFDEKLVGVQVPHASPDVVYKFLYAEYAKLLLDPTGAGNQGEVGRQKPGSELKAEPLPAFVRSEVESRARGAEKELFTRTACKLCHEVTDVTPEVSGASRYQITKPNLPQMWMPAAIFNHGAHEEIRCESCHTGARDSKVTTDVLLPTVKECRNCHAGHESGGKVLSDCTTCHSFHDPLALPTSQKRSIDEIIKDIRRG